MGFSFTVRVADCVIIAAGMGSRFSTFREIRCRCASERYTRGFAAVKVVDGFGITEIPNLIALYALRLNIANVAMVADK